VNFKTAGLHLMCVKHLCAFEFVQKKGEALSWVIIGILLIPYL
jgi:hypothetical protein